MRISSALFLLLWAGQIHAQAWVPLGLGNQPIDAIAVDWSNNQTIYAGSFSDFSAGTVGGIFKTTNGGTTWDTLVRGVTVFDIKLHPVDPLTIYVVCGINSLTVPGVAKSTNGGLSWVESDSGIQMNSDLGPMAMAIDPEHPDTLYVGTSGNLGGHLCRSTDGGAHWINLGDTTRLRNGVGSILVDPQNSLNIYAGSATGSGLLRSVDGGNTWSYLGLNTAVINCLAWGKTSSTIYAGFYSLYGGLCVSNDSGKTWQSHNIGLPDSANIQHVEVLHREAGDEVFIAEAGRDFGKVFKSDQTWSWTFVGDVGSSPLAALAIGGTHVFAGGWGVFRADIAASLSQANSLPIVPALFQNYPNPFNPNTRIAFQLAKREFVLLRVYNVVGQEVATLENGYLDPGMHYVSFDASHFVSGMYLYRIQTMGYTSTRMMLLLK